MSEKISALVDNELSEFERAQTLKSVGNDPAEAETWTRYHVIGSLLRNESLTHLPDIHRKVSERLENESLPQVRKRAPKVLYAAAASICAVAVAVWLIYSPESTTTQPIAQAPSEDSIELAAVDYGTRWEGVEPGIAESLNALLVEHGEFTAASGMNGLTAYAKFVAYESR